MALFVFHTSEVFAGFGALLPDVRHPIGLQFHGMSRKALQLIAHGSRNGEANADLEHFAAELRRDGEYLIVLASFLELAEPCIEEAGAKCVARGAERVVLLPFFLSSGVHVQRDLTEARFRLATRFPEIEFVLAEPLGRHPLILEIVRERIRAAESAIVDEFRLP